MINCPNCQSKEIGNLGFQQYYCWDCCIQFRMSDDKILDIYQIEEDGKLSSLNDLFLEDGGARAAKYNINVTR